MLFDHAKQMEFGIQVRMLSDGLVEITYPHFDQAIFVGSVSDGQRLVEMIDTDCQRCIDEITADADHGMLDEFTDDLDAVCDANVYPAAGRSNGEYGDEKFGWSETRSRRHVRTLLAAGLIGMGVEAVDPDDTAASDAYTGFQNAVVAGVNRWVDGGHLAEIIERRNSPALSI